MFVLLFSGLSLASPPPDKPGLRIVLGKYTTAAEAFIMWDNDKDNTVILDCRPQAAYYFLKHAPMAVNIPPLFWTGKWDPVKENYSFARNKKFEEQVEK